jgi:hypothetical protein
MSMFCRTKECPRAGRNCSVGSEQRALYLADFPTVEPDPDGKISRLLPYRTFSAGACGAMRCILYMRHFPPIVGHSLSLEFWSDFDFWAFFTIYKTFLITNSVKKK